MMNCKIFLGLSGGVDSSVSALLLREAGYEVHGVMLLLKPPSAQREREAAQAQNTANELGIPLHFLDAVQLFHDTVINNFISEYKIGHTPNPCVLCNPTVKFAALLSFLLGALAIGRPVFIAAVLTQFVGASLLIEGVLDLVSFLTLNKRIKKFRKEMENNSRP